MGVSDDVEAVRTALRRRKFDLARAVLTRCGALNDAHRTASERCLRDALKWLEQRPRKPAAAAVARGGQRHP
jgi:hypothetical protein